jgi:hypothetical protein
MAVTDNTPNLDTPWLEPRADGKGNPSGINRIWWRWLIDVLDDLEAGLPETILTARGQIIRMGATEPEALAAQAANTFLGGDGTDVTVRTAAQVLASLGIAVGTYTPALTNVANLDASTAYTTQYIRVGAMVYVFGLFSADATAAASTLTDLGMSLPIASNLGFLGELAGTLNETNGNANGVIYGDTANGRANLRWLSLNAANANFSFHFGYRII